MAFEGALGYLLGKVTSLATNKADALVDQLLDRAVSFTKDQVSLVLDLDDEIEFLKDVLPELKEMVLNSEARKETEILRGGFRDFVEDAEDILDKLDTELAQRRPSPVADRRRNRAARWFMMCAGMSMGEERLRSRLRLVCGCVPSSSCFDSSDNESVSLIFYLEIAHQLKGLYDGLGKLKSDLARRSQFVASVREGLGMVRERTLEAHRPITNALLIKDFHFIGRNDVKKQVTEELMSKSSSKPSVVLITGMGGIGKTTLVQEIFRTPGFDEHFKIKKWVFVGDELEPNVAIAEIFGQTIEDKNEIPSKLKDRRFLIVLDDCWSGKLKGWNDFWDPLTHGSDGSKVIITSREDISKELVHAPVKSIPLGILSNEECLQIFQSYAFPEGVPSSSNNTSKLLEIGRMIVDKKIKGVPLAARVLGSSLRAVNEEDAWTAVLKGVVENNIRSALMWSYRCLPSHLKQCFAYWSLFPKDSYHEKDKIIRMWMAHGYVIARDDLTLEYIGGTYFDDLVRASLIQCYNGRYLMHDLVHDLAIEVSGGGHLLIEDDQSSDKYSNINKKLRTLVNGGYYGRIDIRKLQFIRVLSLSPKVELTGINFGIMIHLRYLDLFKVGNIIVPESICDMYNLQTLCIDVIIQNFPLSMWKLPNLRHLIGGEHLRMPGISRSTSLQSIDNFNLFNMEDIIELGDLKELRGKLKINHLNHIQNKQSALEARISNKEYIEELVLEWDGSSSTSDEMQKDILENLCPHRKLCILEIKSYMGDQYPSWLGGKLKHLLNLVKLTLSHIHHLTELPPLGHHPHLEYLHIKDSRNVRCIGNEFYGNEYDRLDIFPSLKEMHLNDMSILEEWNEYATFDKDRITRWFPSLELLDISSCMKLRSLPRLPRHLKKLIISGTRLRVLPEIWTCSNDSNRNNHLLCLEKLKIESCPLLYPDKWFRKYRMPFLASLRLCYIGKCTNLIISCSLERVSLLTIRDMPALESITFSIPFPMEEPKRCVLELPLVYLLFLHGLNHLSIVDSEGGKIEAAPLRLFIRKCYPSSKLQANVWKFISDEEYPIKNVRNILVDNWEFLLEVDPGTIVGLEVYDVNLKVSHHDQKRLMRWFQNLSSIKILVFHVDKVEGYWPPYMPIHNLCSLESISFETKGLLKSFPQLPPSLRKEGLKIIS